jgi:hypothetical protein
LERLCSRFAISVDVTGVLSGVATDKHGSVYMLTHRPRPASHRRA